MTPRVGVSALERLEALVANPELYALADVIPNTDRSRGGRPRHYPVWLWVLYDALLSVYASARQVEAELAHPIVWAHLRHLIRQRFPDEPERWLPATPIRRHHYQYGRSRYLAEPDTLERLGEVHRATAAGQARELGLLDPDGPGSFTHPDLSRMIYSDGKVITPLFRAQPGDRRLDRTTGELRPTRAEPDAALHFEGTGETAWGTKWVIAAVRSTDIHGRIILDVEWVPKPGGEAASAMDCFERLAPHTPGTQGVLYDTALRGVHHQRLLRDLGWLPVNKVTAAVASVKQPRRTGGRRVEKSAHIEDITIDVDGQAHTVALFAKGGAVGIGQLADTGERIFTELRRVRTHRRADKNGTFRWYNEYALPDRYGAGTITVRLHGTDDDAKRRFNRTENIRPIAATDPDFARLYRRRNDAESINRALDDTLWLRRAHSIGHHRQHVNMLTHALMVNSLALHLHRRRRQIPDLPAAA